MQVSIQRKVLAALAAVVASVLLLATVGAGVAWALNVDCTINFAALC
jgi:hypothetical protein